jgi:tungstate transport system substrate-binding protein
MRARVVLALICCLCLAAPAVSHAGPRGFVLLASTIGPVDAGIVGALEDQFEKEAGIRVRHVGAGTGAALDIARKGNVDLVLVHAKSLEEKFIAEGYGTQRIPLMYNDFVILGPVADPAGIKGMTSAAAALQAIAGKQAPFVTRGDKSGTNVAELELWAKAGITPEGTWYIKYEKGAEGNAPTLRFTNERQAYTVIDRATYLALKKEISLAILVEGDTALLNYISLTPVNKAKFPWVNAADAQRFVAWLTSPTKGQRIIATFGTDTFGSPFFFPNSDAWNKAHPKKP